MADRLANGKNGKELDAGLVIKNRLYDQKADIEPNRQKNSLTECCCNGNWVEFTQNTTLHGLKYIWLPGAFRTRRLLWLVLTVTCVAIMSFQIIDRIIYYYDYPVTVNVQVNYNKTLFFPTLTLCNQNAFRASKAAQLQHYQLLTDLYTGRRSCSDCDYVVTNSSHMTLRDLFTNTTHTKDDLIVSCTWRGEVCGSENFTEVVTDHGVCYTFNLPDHDTRDVHRVFSPGAENGLSLTLNVEQYEYMPGPHDAAGVKILIHDHRQFPKVQELGIALPTGTHSFVGMQLISVVNLPKPYGECSSPDLSLFPQYSLENCEVECLTKQLDAVCGCRLFYMPRGEDSPESCTLQEHHDCYLKKLDYIRQSVRDTCSCPVPCAFQIFDPTVSYATTSTFVIDRFLSNSNRSALKMKYKNARDITHRLQKNRADLLKSLTENLDRKFQTLNQVILDELQVSVEEQEKHLVNVSSDYLWNWNKTELYFNYQDYILQKNLVRARDAMNERTFSVLGHGVQEFTFGVEKLISQLVDPQIDDPAVREVLFLMAKNKLNARLDIGKRTLQNYTQLIKGFLNTSSIFNYRFKNFSRKNSNLILPRELLLQAFTRSNHVRVRSLRVERDIITMATWMKEYGKIADKAFYNKTVNSTEIYITNVKFLRASREFLQSKSMFFNDFIQWPVTQLELRKQTFLQMRTDFIRLGDTMFGYFSSVSELIHGIERSLMADMKVGIQMCKDYLAYGNVSKVDVAEHFRSEKIQNGINNLKVFFDTVRNRGQNVYDGWDQLSMASQQMWNFTLSQVNLMRYWKFKNIRRYLRNYTEVAAEIAQEFARHRDMIDVRSRFLNKDEEFLQSFKSLAEHMEMFHSSSHVDSAFVRDNFLKVNVFYRELSYEKITQQVAYDIFALLCDIGGSMGLFIGASVMTIFEIMDLLMYHSVTATEIKK
ncbi:LOW QUALITY PROTEIN: uncharacterized protein LOC124271872 [Haliotis rubra]|uniref:LOW QUALITY PROTEIN: uncharacterized protein LOC124271872 n=1 Tax=Haliotis rubra TaxID=36100 RepID=UPI001EE4EB82|nr:LOW QUALITY PROTEIN: uncharacterized protein LOC124271872 [Haliotis rubra]